jgi:hypothetical protein
VSSTAVTPNPDDITTIAPERGSPLSESVTVPESYGGINRSLRTGLDITGDFSSIYSSFG